MTKLTPQELAAGRNVMKQCLAVKAGESVLIVTDPARTDLAGIFESTAKEFTDSVELISFTDRNVMKQCLAVKAGESVLIVTDPARTDLAGIFESTAKEFTDSVELISF